MGVNYNPSTITDGLVFSLDMSNPKCYPSGFGSKTGGMKDLSLNPVGVDGAMTFETTSGDGPDFVDEGERSHFHFTRTERNRIQFGQGHGGSNHLLTKMGHSGSGTEALAMTIEFVIRIESVPTGAGNNGFGIIRPNAGEAIGCHIRNNSSVSGTGAVNFGYVSQSNYTNNDSPVVVGEWYYGAVTRDNGAGSTGTAKWYDKNGLSKTSGSVNLQTVFGTTSIQIGNQPGAFDGDIALVRVYKRDLTESEVRTNFQALRGRFGL